MIHSLAFAAVALSAPALVLAAEDSDPTPAKLAEIAGKLAPSLVQVEWTAQYDKGVSPGGDRMRAWQAYASNPGVDPDSWATWDEFIKQERPKAVGGFLIGERRVFTADLGLHPRFLKTLQVRFGDTVVDAKPVAYGASGDAVILELTGPLSGAKPLAFDPGKKGPYLSVSYGPSGGVWATRISPAKGGVTLTSRGEATTGGDAATVLLDQTGTPVALCGGALPTDETWKVAPDQWPSVPAERVSELLTQLEAESANHLLRVRANFRSPRSGGGGRSDFYGYGRHGGGDDEMVEWDGLAVLVDPGTLLVLANLSPKTTGRLERVTAFLPDGTQRTATFDGTLKDWGGFFARLEQPMSSAARLSTGDALDLRDKLLLKAEVMVRGDTRTAYFDHARWKSFYRAYKGRVFPMASATSDSDGSESGQNFYYSQDGQLVGLPLARRERPGTEERWGYSGDGEPVLVPVSLVSDLLSDRSGSIDSENRPLSEAEENRLAWLGVELQGMDPELARASDVMDETSGGSSGGIVTFIYPNSPGSEAGLEVGDIVLRLEVEGQPKPLEVRVDDHGMGGMMDQFWQYLDQMPGEYFDRLPTPWGSRENTLTRALTDIGFGTPFVAHVWRNGELIKKDMKIMEGPNHYDSAPRFKASDAVGITVRDLTYEVRRYFQMTDEEPGVIISKIEPGSKAAVAGLKPFEIIRTADDKPIASVKEFEAVVNAGGEIKLAVKRMTQGRTVKLKLDAPKPAEEKTGEKPEQAASLAPAPAP